ncbi:MAG: L,D-transpeptidase family protein [Anaerolineales bacterium]|nr:L,D-transpeptidase family protein [Anaerolineales bacterium]MCZ2122369.1 L,D-transpeptidase family protein [Anaerolineales bacterium]
MNNQFAQRPQNQLPKAKPNAAGPNQTASAESGGASSKKQAAKKRNLLLPIGLIVIGCAVFAFAAWSAVRSPVLASILGSPVPAPQTSRISFAQVEIPKPAPQAQPIAQVEVEVSPTINPTVTASLEPTLAPTTESLAQVTIVETPTLENLVVPTNTAVAPTIAAAVETTQPSGGLIAEIVQDTPTSEYVAPTAVAEAPPAPVGDGVHWIDVDLSQQRVYAYAGDTLVNSFIVSTGTWLTPTVTGSFKIWVKLRSSDMSGPGYYLPDVPYVMYFYKDYGLHGTYWHNNFGTPMSHGCVNLSIPDAEWIYNFSAVGTVVNVHY